MTDIDVLGYALSQFARLPKEEFETSLPYWHFKEYRKGEYYNEYRNVCRYLGFITDGYFRSYMIDEKGNEKNVFFYHTHSFVVTFKSFINQVPCDYYTQAMTGAGVLCIGLHDLLSLYESSHHWERVGRLAAQEAFNVAIERAESMLFKTPEERYKEMLEKHPDFCNHIPLY